MSEQDQFSSLFAPEGAQEVAQSNSETWKVLMVDNEPDIHAVMRLALQDVVIEERPLQLLDATSAEEAKSRLNEHPDTALILLDVVMETEKTGLELVHHIRKEMGNRTIQIVIVTGQPGYAPERDVIQKYEIDGYRLKSDLSADKLFVTVYTALRAHKMMSKLEHQHIQLQLALDAANQTWFDVNVQTGEIQITPEYARMIGYDPETFTTSLQNWIDNLHPDDHDAVIATFQSCLESGGPLSAEYRRRTHDGGWAWFHSIGKVVEWDDANKPLRMIGVHAIIDDRKQVQFELEKSRNMMNVIVENIPAMIFLKRAEDLKFELFNKAGEELLGYKRQSLIGKNDYDFFDKKQADFFTAKDREVLKSHHKLNIPEEFINSSDGSEKILHTRKVGLYDDKGNPTHLLGISVDITERKQLEAELVKEKNQAQRYLDIAAVMIVVLDVNGSITLINKKGCEILGYDEQEILGKNWFELCIAEVLREEVKNVFRQLMTGDVAPVENFENSVLTKTGEERMIAFHNTILQDDSGNISGILSSGEDITERKKAEQALIRYKNHLEEEVELRTAALVLARDAAEAANKAKSVFLARMSHELRTPLNAILGFSSLMLRDAQQNKEQRETLDIINRSGAHLLTLINDVLEMAKIEAGKTQLEIAPFDLGAMIYDVIDLMRIRADEKGLSLQIEQSSDFLRYINGDEARLRQILINLIGNAIKFTDKGGVIIHFGMKYTGVMQHLLIEVEDTGPSISVADQQRLFEPFVQLGKQDGDNQGSGLGLSITQQFVKLMGGKISVSSAVGKGSTFSVEVPVERIDASEIPNPVASTPSDVTGLLPGQPDYRILIVEDQLENQLLLKSLLDRIGIKTKVAENGEQGVALFQSWKPHLILMDRRMPVMDGIEATRYIRALPGGKDVKIIGVTASAFKEQRDEIYQAGMNDFVSKPYRFNDIYASLTRQLGLQYSYAQSQERSPPIDVKLTPQMLAVLPQGLREELKIALEILETERIHAGINQVAEYDADLHQKLLLLADNFDYEAILTVLEQVKPDSLS